MTALQQAAASGLRGEFSWEEYKPLRQEALFRQTVEQLKERIKTIGGGSMAGNKEVLVSRCLRLESPYLAAVKARMKAFFWTKAHGKPVTVRWYGRIFNLIDRVDLTLSYIEFPWRIEHFPVIFLIYLIRVALVACHSAKCETAFNFLGCKEPHPEEKQSIRAFTSELATALYWEDKMTFDQAK